MRIYYSGGFLYTDFELLENAIAYRIEIFSESGNVIWDVTLPSKSCTPPVKVPAGAHVLEDGGRYTGRISVITVQEESSVVVSQKLSWLRSLKAAVMEAAGDEGCLTFDAQLLQTVAGDSYGLSLVKELTGERSIGLINVKEPLLDADRLTLLVTGASDTFGAKAEIEIKIWMTDEEKAEMDISVALEPLWLFSTLFSSLKNTVYDFLKFKETHLILSADSYERRLSADASLKIKQGINFYGIFPLPILLNGGNKSEKAQIWCGGRIEITDGFPRITISNLNQIPELSITHMGTGYCFTQGRLVISNERIKAKSGQSLSQQTAAIYAQSRLTGETAEFKIDLPVRRTPLEAVQMDGAAYLEPFLKYQNRLFPAKVMKLFHLDNVRVCLIFFAAGNSRTSWQMTACEETGNQAVQLIPNLIRLEHVRFTYSLHCYPGVGEQKWQYFGASLAGEVLMNDSLRLAVDMNIPDRHTWKMRISPNTQNGLLPALATLLGMGRGLLDALPPFFSGLAAFNLDDIVIEANPFKGSVSALSMELESSESWRIIPGVLTITSWKLYYNIKKTSDKWRQSVILHGQMESKLSMGVIVQIGTDSLSISLDQVGLKIPSVSTIFDALGLKEWTAAMPAGIKDLGNIEIEAMNIKVSLSDTPAVDSVGFSMRTADAWNVLPDKNLTFTEVFASFYYHTKSQAPARGNINAKLIIMETPIWVSISNVGTDGQWRLQSGVPMIHIPGFAQLADWMAPEAGMAFLPESVIPFRDGFDLTALELGINLSVLEIERIYFRIQNRTPWNLLPDALSIKQAGIICNIKQPFQDHAEYSFEIRGAVQIACLLIQIMAVKKHANDKWRLEGRLDRNVEISFESLEKELHLTSFPLPYEYGFPKKLEIMSADAIIIPEEMNLQFRINTKYNWKFSLGPLELAIKTIGFMLRTEQKQGGGVVDYTVSLEGGFDLCGIDTKLHFETGSEEGKDSIFTGRLNGEEIDQVLLPQLAGAVSTDSGAKWGELGLPDSLTIPKFEYLDLYLNLTREQYTIAGSVKGIGRAAVVASQMPDAHAGAQSWGYFIGVALEQNFRFSSIVEELGVIDDILRIEQAGLVISSFEADSLKTCLDSVEPCAGLLPHEGGRGTLAVKPGAMIYGRVILAGTIFENIGRLGAGGKNKPLALDFSAQVAKNPLDTCFEAELEGFSILNILQFDGIRFKYSPNNRNQFELDGILSLDLGDSVYSFRNCFTVSEDTASFFAQTTQKIQNPLGVPGLTIENLELKLGCEFANEDGADTSINLYLGGTVGFGKRNGAGTYPLCLTGSLLLEQSEFKVFEVQLESPLSVDDLFAGIFASRIWPEGFLKIVFQTGKLYYAKEPVQVAGVSYEKGFHMITQVSIYDIVFSIAADMEDGIKISGSALLPLDMKFIQLTDAQCSGKGPGVVITVKDSGNCFGITGGLSLFNEKFLSIPRMDYDTKAGEFKGTVSYNGSVEVLRSSIRFSWNKEKGLRITEWPLSYVTDALQYAQLFEQASQLTVSECGVLAGMVFDKAITSEFKIQPDFSQLGNSRIELGVSYCIIIAGKKLIESRLPSILVLLALLDEISFTKLAQAIIETITSNAVSIAEQILNDPDQLVKLIATVGLKSAAKETLSALLCNGVKSSIAADVGAAGASGSASSAASSAAAGNVDAACAAASSASAAACASGEAFGYAAGFFGAVAAAAALGGGSSKEYEAAKEKEKEQQRKKEMAEALIRETQNEIEKMLTLTSHEVQFIPDEGTVCICWKDLSATASDTKLSYEIAAYCDSQSQEILHVTTDKNSISFRYDRPFKEKIVVEIKGKAEVVQNNVKYTYVAKPYQAIIFRPQPVKNLTLRQTGCQITASWQQGQEQSYQLRLYKDGSTAAEYSETGFNRQSSVIACGDIRDGAVCTVKVGALHAESQLFSEDVEAQIQYRHSIAFSLNVSYKKEKIEVGWNRIDGASKYQVTILNGKSDLIHTSEHSAANCQFNLLTGEPALYCGEQYVVTVEAVSASFGTAWKAEQNIQIPDASERIPELLVLLVKNNSDIDAVFRAVYSRFRTITAIDLSRYIYHAGILKYPPYEILRGLKMLDYDLKTASEAVKELLPDIKIELMTAAIMAVYGDLESDLMLAYELKAKGVAAEAAALEIKKEYPQILISRMAEILMTVF